MTIHEITRGFFRSVYVTLVFFRSTEAMAAVENTTGFPKKKIDTCLGTTNKRRTMYIHTYKYTYIFVWDCREKTYKP